MSKVSENCIQVKKYVEQNKRRLHGDLLLVMFINVSPFLQNESISGKKDVVDEMDESCLDVNKLGNALLMSRSHDSMKESTCPSEEGDGTGTTIPLLQLVQQLLRLVVKPLFCSSRFRCICSQF